MSPLGLGYSAEGENVGAVMEGRDGGMWRVVMKKTPPCDIRVWVRVPTGLEKEAPVIKKKGEAQAEQEKVAEAAEAAKPTEKVAVSKKTKPTKKEVAEPPAEPTKKEVAEPPAEPTAKPTKQMSGFNAFVKVRIAEIKTADPSVKDAFKRAVDDWKAMTDAEKKEAGAKALASLSD
jgi:outer membrane biosynthesis protein TonB